MNESPSRRLFVAAVLVPVLAFAGVIAALSIENASLTGDATSSAPAAQIRVTSSATADQQLSIVTNEIASSSSDLAQVKADMAEATNK